MWLAVLMLCVGLARGERGRITEEECEDAEFHLDPDDCPTSYYRCTPDGKGGWTIEQHTCPGGTIFNPAISNCDWPINVSPDICDDITHKPTEPTSPRPTTDMPPPGADTRLVCYFGAWAFYRPGFGSFDIVDIDPYICTHLCYGFANMNNVTYEVVPYDPWYDLAPWDEGCEGGYYCNFDSYRRFNGLKTANPKLKTFISIGGWNSGSEQWSEMAMDPAKRKIFVSSSVKFAQKYGFDGVDFDWEYPGSREGADPAQDRQDFTDLVLELSAALKAAGMLLSAAVAADPVKAELAYDIPIVLAAMDFVNIMDYDYHGAWDNFTGHSTPLYGRTEEDAVDSPGYRFNVNDSISWYLEQGAPASKINLGLATYGRGWRLPEGTEETGLYCPAVGGIPMGPYTRQDGTWSYYEILQAFNNETLNSNLAGAVPKAWTIVRDGCYLAPYAVNGPFWIGYEDVDAIVLKAQYTNTRGLGGAMLFSLDQDDFRGDYGAPYTLTQAARAVLLSGEELAPENILGENSGCESAPICSGGIPV